MTNNLVEAVAKESGARTTRATRSPSPAGSASSVEEYDLPPKKKSKSERNSKSSSNRSDTVAMAAISALQKIAGLTNAKGAAKVDDDDDDDEFVKPTMVNWPNYHVKDNGQTVLDMKLRNALKTINAKPSKYFKYFDRQIKPAMETIEIDHLNFNSVNPRITKKMHDRGALLELKYFDPGNISVTSRPPNSYLIPSELAWQQLWRS